MKTFTKMQALGNDFVIVNSLHAKFKTSKTLIKKLADRHFGIGFDQLLVLEQSNKKDIDFNYRIFNADGSEVSQCGNGVRCIARYIHEKKLSKKNQLTFSTRAGLIITHREKNNQINVNMGIPVFEPKKIPFYAEKLQDIYTLNINNQDIQFCAVALGNPHAVIEVDDVKTAPVKEKGAIIESHPKFPQRVNVGFMQMINRNHILLRVFERGAGETLACGSGACAAAVCGILLNKLNHKVKVDLPGGRLEISWKGKNSPVWMKGPAEFVYDGTLSPIK